MLIASPENLQAVIRICWDMLEKITSDSIYLPFGQWCTVKLDSLSWIFSGWVSSNWVYSSLPKGTGWFICRAICWVTKTTIPPHLIWQKIPNHCARFPFFCGLFLVSLLSHWKVSSLVYLVNCWLMFLWKHFVIRSCRGELFSKWWSHFKVFFDWWWRI